MCYNEYINNNKVENKMANYNKFIEYLESHGVHRAIPLAVKDRVEKMMDNPLTQRYIETKRLMGLHFLYNL